MIVWINGTHGVGKTTTARLVQRLLADARVLDAEKVGETLMDITPGLHEREGQQTAQDLEDGRDRVDGERDRVAFPAQALDIAAEGVQAGGHAERPCHVDGRESERDDGRRPPDPRRAPPCPPMPDHPATRSADGPASGTIRP